MEKLTLPLDVLALDDGMVVMQVSEGIVPLGNRNTGEIYLMHLGSRLQDNVAMDLIVGWHLKLNAGEVMAVADVARLALTYNLGLVRPPQPVGMQQMHESITGKTLEAFGGLNLAEVADRAYAVALRYHNGEVSPAEMAGLGVLLAPVLMMMPPNVLAAKVEMASNLVAPDGSTLILQ